MPRLRPRRRCRPSRLRAAPPRCTEPGRSSHQRLHHIATARHVRPVTVSFMIAVIVTSVLIAPLGLWTTADEERMRCAAGWRGSGQPVLIEELLFKTAARDRRPEPALAHGRRADQRRRLRPGLVRRRRGARRLPQRRARPGRTRTCASWPRTSSRRCSWPTSGRRSARRCRRPTATRSATAAGCSCTTATSATSTPCGAT